MKSQLLLPLAAGLSLWGGLISLGVGQEASNITDEEIRLIGPLPEDKVVETIKKSDRNPFAEKVLAVLSEDKGESEDSKLRSILGRIPISGVIHDRDGRFKVMVGRRLLQEGDKVPPLIAGQTALLRVSKVTDKLVEIAWVEDQANAAPQKFVRAVRVNEGRIDQMMEVPGEDGKAGTMLRIPVTTRGEYLQEDPKQDGGGPDSKSSPADLVSQDETPRNVPVPIREMNHRPAEPSLRSQRGIR